MHTPPQARLRMSNRLILGDMVTVARRFNSLEAELLRGRLAADGIPAVLGDAHTVQTDTLLTTALGGVRIRVPSSFEAQARRTLADIESGSFMLEEGEDIAGSTQAGIDARDSPQGRAEADAVAAARRAGLTRYGFAAVTGIVFLGVLAAFAS
jgi:hypothetical protein